MTTTGIIDAHAMLGRENHLALEPEDLLRRMDAAGIATAVARAMGAWLTVDEREGNDRILKAHPRIRGLATANPWRGAKAVGELKRARDLGAVGLFLHPSRQGFFPTEPVAGPVLDAAAELGWPVMMHTGTFVNSDLLALVEVARKRPGTTFIAGFGGFADMWFELPGVFGEVKNLVLDASMIWGEAVQEIVRKHGPDRVLFGSAEPRNRYAVGLAKLKRMNFDDAEMNAILRENAKRLFGI